MADSKVTSLSAVTAASVASTDVLYIIAAGASKKITTPNLAMALMGTIGLGLKDTPGTRGLITFPSARTANTSFNIWSNSSTFSGGPDGATTRDDTFAWGYNQNISGIIDTTQPTIADGFEASYWNGSKMIMESNFSFTNTVAKNSYNVRPREFAINQDDSISDATLNMTWHYRFGASGGWMRFTVPGVSEPMFQMLPDSSFHLYYDGTNGGSIRAQKIGSDSVLAITAGSEGAPYVEFLAAIVPGNGVGSDANTGTNGWLINNPFNYGNNSQTLSGTKVLVRMNIGGVPYFWHVYPTAT